MQIAFTRKKPFQILFYKSLHKIDIDFKIPFTILVRLNVDKYEELQFALTL